MLRSTFDKLVSAVGALLAVLLLIISGLAFWASSFATGTVTSQLKDQAITMPTAAQFPAGEESCLKPYAGTQLDNGDKAKAYADCYIAAHMSESSGGQTYAQVSAAQAAAAKQDPNSAETTRLTNLKATLFQGNALRSMLLTAYAFGTIGKIAFVGAITTLVGGILMAVLSLLGFLHARRSGDKPLDHPRHTETLTAAPATTAAAAPATQTVYPAGAQGTDGPQGTYPVNQSGTGATEV